MISAAKLAELQAELPDHKLLLTFPAGLPVSELVLEIRVLARERVSALQEYILRCISKKVATPAAMDLVLGLGEEFIRPTLAYLQSYDLIDEASWDREAAAPIFALTERGTTALMELAVRRPTVLSLACTWDSLVGELKPRRKRVRLASKAAIAADAVHAIPAKFDPPLLGDIDKEELQGVVRDMRRADPSSGYDGEVLDVLEISRSQAKYQKVDIAVFSDSKDTLAFRILDRGARLRDLEQILARLAEQQPDVLPVEVYVGQRQSRGESQWLTAAEIDEARANAESLAEAEEHVERLEAVSPPVVIPDSPAAASTTREQLVTAVAEQERVQQELTRLQEVLNQGIRYIETEEHRHIMERAFAHARESVIIIAPWLNRVAVDNEFKKWVDVALSRGVNVTIGWGYPDEGNVDQKKTHDRSRQVAESLIEFVSQSRKRSRSVEAQPTRGRLRIVELGDTHGKVLIADVHFAVVGSFNWLSFRGQRRVGQLAIRQETSCRIGIPTRVQEIRDAMMAKIEAAAQDPHRILVA